MSQPAAPSKPSPMRVPAWLRWLVAVMALLGMLLTMVLFAPAGAVTRVLDSTGSEIRLWRPSGRLHAGSGELVQSGESLGRLQWQLEPAALLRGALQARITLTGPEHALTGHARLTLAGLWVEQAQGTLSAGGLQTLLNPYDIYPGGEITLHGLRFELAGDGKVRNAHGDLEWSGGPVAYVLAGQRWHADFPPLQAQLRQQAEAEPRLEVLDDRNQPLLDLTLDATGWAHLRVRYRFIELAGFPWPDGPPPDTVLIELSEKIRH